MSKEIAFIGLGNMGAPMACNLATSGYEVVGFDIHAPCPNELISANSAPEAAEGKEIVVTMLPDGAALRTVADEILPVMPAASILLDCSTVDITSARHVAGLAKGYGIDCIDAPVSGGVVGAKSGTLTLMAGGPKAAYRRVEPLFNILGGRTVHCGAAAGAGQAAKICNNMILGATMIVTCEAFALADELGLDRQKMFDVVSSSSGDSWSMNTYCPVKGVGPNSPADHDYQPGFAADLMLKDLRLAQKAADSAGLVTPIGQLATQIYADFVENGIGSRLDFSAILQALVSEKAG